MSSYISEIHLCPWSKRSAHNGNGRSANYINAYHERNRNNYHKKRNSYKLKRTPAVEIIHDPLSFCNGGFIRGATFVMEDWERMRSSQVITENTIFKQGGCIWRMVTLKDWRGNKSMKRVKVGETTLIELFESELIPPMPYTGKESQ